MLSCCISSSPLVYTYFQSFLNSHALTHSLTHSLTRVNGTLVIVIVSALASRGGTEFAYTRWHEIRMASEVCTINRRDSGAAEAALPPLSLQPPRTRGLSFPPSRVPLPLPVCVCTENSADGIDSSGARCACAHVLVLGIGTRLGPESCRRAQRLTCARSMPLIACIPNPMQLPRASSGARRTRHRQALSFSLISTLFSVSCLLFSRFDPMRRDPSLVAALRAESSEL